MASKNTSKGFIEASVRLLTLPEGQQPDPADWPVAKRLIDSGHATGRYMIDRHSGPGERVEMLILFAPTMQGLIQADEWADSLRRQTWQHRSLQALAGLASYAGGFATAVLTDVSKPALIQWLGW
jgi:hypothetical protein